MKTLRNALLITGILLLFYQCDKSDIGAKYYKTGDNIELKFNESSQVLCSIISDTLSIKLLNINDSRCPKGGVCFWAGEAHISLIANQKCFKSDTIFLCLGTSVAPKYKNQTEFFVGNNRFRATLKDVLPFPSLSATTSDQYVILSITKIE